MEKNSTHNNLIKKLYNEVDAWEDAFITEALQLNWPLAEEFQEMKEVKEQLETVKYSPSNTSINIILAHSRRTAPLETLY